MKNNLQYAIDFLWKHLDFYREEIRNGRNPNFDLPDYANLPNDIHKQFSDLEIQAIQCKWTQFLGWDTQKGCVVKQFENKREFHSAVRKDIKAQKDLQKQNEPVILGDFLAWAIKNKYWIRGFESIDRNNEYGWSFVWATQCGFVSDEDIRKVVPAKTAKQWDCWGR